MNLVSSVQWNPSKTDTIGAKDFVLDSEVSLARGLVVDHTPPTIIANHDKAATMDDEKMIRDLSISSS